MTNKITIPNQTKKKETNKETKKKQRNKERKKEKYIADDGGREQDKNFWPTMNE